MRHLSNISTVLLLSLLLAAACRATSASEPVDVSGMRPPEWQLDPELSAAWARFSGRYIYQRACTGCHAWGPDHLSREEWQTYLDGFPGNHEPDVREDYSDLTAQFTPGKYVPDQAQQQDALSAFLLAAAPEESRDDSGETWDGLPGIGGVAPSFSIVDIEGRAHDLDAYRGRRLVLVFSRAHW